MPFLHTRNNLIENNEVERVLQKLGDGAAINVTGAGEGNLIRHNYVHDIFASEWVSGCLAPTTGSVGPLGKRTSSTARTPAPGSTRAPIP